VRVAARIALETKNVSTSAAGGFAGELSKGRKTMTNTLMKISLVICCFLFAGWTDRDDVPSTAQVVALDECDPATFNAPTAVGPDFCKNVTVGAFTTFSELFRKAAAGTPDPNWDFEPDALTVKKGTILSAVNQGGEPHTFTEVTKFGGGFIGPLNGGEETVSECAGGFSRVAVAKTRILQGSQLQVTGLSKGEHFFQCCIHPWMRMKVEVK
jgi:plastocyanin